MTSPPAILSTLAPKTAALYHALPRGVRIPRWRFAEIALRVGLDARGATGARGVLLRHRMLEEFEPRDGSTSIEKWEWRVRE